MRRRGMLLLLVVLVICLPLSAFSAGTYYGSVVCERSVTVRAPFGGPVSGIQVLKGNRIHPGEPICTLETTKVYAPADGTVTAVFAVPGDLLEDVKNLYGNAVYLMPANRLNVNASMKTAKKNADSFVSPGQAVYLQAGRGRGMKTGEGRILTVTAANPETESDTAYTVEILSGAFIPGEKVNVYREESLDKDTLLGGGTANQVAAQGISGDGSLLRMHVKAGDEVKRGDLLFETVNGTLEPQIQQDNVILSETEAIVSAVDATEGATVEKGAALITLYPLDSLQVCLTAGETELKEFTPGRAVSVTFAGEETSLEGTVASISYLNESTEAAGSGYASYKVYIDFAAKDTVRMGMLAMVELK